MNAQTKIRLPSHKPLVYEKIAAVQGALARHGIGKDRRNDQQNYAFRGIDDVYNALAPLLAEHQLCVLPRMLTREVTERRSVKTYNGQSKETVLFYVIVEAEFDFVAAEDGSIHTVRTFGEAMDSGDKATSKAMSAAYKYAAFMAFAIPTEGDNDAEATTHEVQHEPPADPLTIFPPKVQADIRKTAAAAIQAFSEGNEWGAYEEASSLWNKYEEGDKRNQIKLALAHIFKPHSALRASLKASAERERAGTTA